MKAFIVLSAVFACALANGLDGGYGYAAPALVSKVLNVNTGHSTQSRKQDQAGNYAFAYDAAWQDGAWGSGAHSRQESGDAWGNKEGSYSLNIGDGRSRLVKYVADGAGFRASIKTNEPGIVASNPAAADINTPYGGHGGLAGGYGLATAHAPAVVATAVGGYTDSGYGKGDLGLAGGYGGVGLAGGLAGGYGGLGGGLALGGLSGGLAGGYGAGLAGGLGHGAY